MAEHTDASAVPAVPAPSNVTSRGSVRAALRYPAFRLLVTGLAFSLVGNWLYNLALVAVVYERTGSSLWAGITAAARIVPLVALGPVGGMVADRFDRRRVMVTCDLVRLALMLALALVAVTRLPVVLAPVLAVLATAASTPYSPAVSASIPKLVADRDLSGANAAKSGVNSLGIVVGPAIGGVLLLLGAPALAFVINAATFAVSAVCVIAIRTAGSTFRVATHRRQAGLLRSVGEGAVVLNAHPRALWQVGADVVCSLVFGMQTVLLIGVAQRAGLGLHGYGYLFAALGVGCLAGTTLATRALHGSRPRAVLPLSLVAVGFPMLLLAIVTAAPAAVVLIALSGAGSILVEVMTHTLLQRMLPEDALGGAFGFTIPAAAAGMVAGSLAAPVLAGALSDTGALLACGAVPVAYAAALLIASLT